MFAQVCTANHEVPAADVSTSCTHRSNGSGETQEHRLAHSAGSQRAVLGLCFTADVLNSALLQCRSALCWRDSRNLTNPVLTAGLDTAKPNCTPGSSAALFHYRSVLETY